MTIQALKLVDILILIAGALAVCSTAFFSSASRSSTSKKEDDNAEGKSDEFFLADRQIPWWAIGASLLAANIGNEHFVGQAGTAASTGLAVALYEWLASYLLFLLGFVFAPIYLEKKISTIPEWFEIRFNTSCRVILAVLSLFGAVLTKISASLFAGALLCEVVLGINFWLSLPFILILTGLYSISGGLRAIVYTDVIQALIFMIGGTVGSIYAVQQVGGWKQMLLDFEKFPGLQDFPHVIREPSSEFGWPGLFFGQMIGSVWYWIIDQEMSQRVLCCKSIRHSKGGTIFAGFLKILPPFIICFPGMAARIMYERCHAIGGTDFPMWCDDKQPGDSAYLLLLIRTFPTGVVGLILLSMVVSMMSALSAVFNSASAVFTLDIYLRFINPKASSTQIVRVGQAFTIFLVICSFCWLLAIRAQSSGIFLISQNIQTHISPPLAVIALAGIYIPWVNGAGGLAGIVVGVVAGLAQYVPSLLYQTECLNGGGNWFVCMSFNNYAGCVAVLTFIITLLFSRLFPDPTKEKETSEKVDVKSAKKVLEYKDMDWNMQKSKTKDNLLLFGGFVMMASVTMVIIIFR